MKKLNQNKASTSLTIGKIVKVLHIKYKTKFSKLMCHNIQFSRKLTKINDFLAETKNKKSFATRNVEALSKTTKHAQNENKKLKLISIFSINNYLTCLK